MKKPFLSLYWKCQIIGWSVVSLYWGVEGFAMGGFDIRLGILQFLSDFILCICLTHFYRNFALKHNWQQLDLNKLLKRIVLSAFVLSVCYTIFTIAKIYFFRSFFLKGFPAIQFSVFLPSMAEGVFMGGIRLMSIWLLAYHLYQYAQREIRITKENAQLVILTKDAQLNSLSDQLNPHFLFNSLNNIKALVIEKPKSARRAIDLLSEILRTSLYGRQEVVTTIKDELNLVKDYLELEKLRKEERLQFTIEIDEILEQNMILRMSIQTLVENAIKHGIDQQKDGGLIVIRGIKLADFIQITVQNPGQLIADYSGVGLGLKNLKERLNLQLAGKAGFDIINQSEGTVLSTLLIPLI